MVVYNCKRCGYSTNLRGNIKRHFTKKKICKPILNNCSIEQCIKEQIGENIQLENKHTEQEKSEDSFFIECEFCNQKFKNQRYLDDHLRRSCKYIKHTLGKKIKPYIDEVNELKNELHIERIQRKKDQEIISELKNQIDVLLKGKGNTYNYNQNIIIQPFGKENVSYIKDTFVNNLINEGAIHCIPKLLKHIHFNDKHIENHNIKIPNKKKSVAQIYNGLEWEYTDKQRTINNMADKALHIINEHTDGSNKYMEELTDKITENNRDVIKKISKDTELMILNHQEILKE